MRGAGSTGVQKTPFAVAASSCQSTILPRAVHRGVLRRVRMASPVVIAFHKPRGLTVEQASAPTHGEVCAKYGTLCEHDARFLTRPSHRRLVVRAVEGAPSTTI